jgi:3',5'-cyclic-AMP phosphodiesterase
VFREYAGAAAGIGGWKPQRAGPQAGERAMNTDDINQGGNDRRHFLKCMTWAGTAMVWTVAGGVPRSRLIGSAEAATGTGFNFVQISDSHLGFDKPANPNTTATLQQALSEVEALQGKPAFMIHTGDISHLSKPAQFDTCQGLMQQTGLTTYTVPGEHDILEEDGKSYLNRFGKGSLGDGWYSFNAGGVHFIGLVNVVNLQGNGLGNLGHEQLEWMEHDVKGLSASTPIVVFAHVPLWLVYQDWGWGTADGAQALSYLKRFGSVTVLNGHIHQVLQKVEGHVAFHTARSTAFPQPAPGTAKGPGPVTVPPGQLKHLLGTAQVSLVSSHAPLAIVDTPLEG